MSNCLGRASTCLLALVLFHPTASTAHGGVGPRFFPATITTDDPFAADELALPTITGFNHETDYDFDYAKSIFKGFAISVGIGYADGRDASGWSNVRVTPALELFRSDEHEAIATAGFIREIGGSGSKAVADRNSTYTPELLFGKGFGDLPDGLSLLKPLAITGKFGPTFPTDNSASRTFDWGFTLQYSLPYLQSHVKDVGLGEPFAHMIPIVEFPMSTCTSGDCSGRTTGTINPGVLWQYRFGQIGLEAQIPINRASGKSTGVLVQAHFYLDDLFPRSIGKPIF
jgi:hypothetical protein